MAKTPGAKTATKGPRKARADNGRVRSRFKELLFQKQARDLEAISYRDVQRATGLPLSTVTEWAGDKVKRYSSEAIAALCTFFGCGVGELLEHVPAGVVELASKGKG